MNILILLTVLFCQIGIGKASDNYQTIAAVSVSYSPSTWVYWDDTITITTTTYIPCPTTVYTTLTKCRTCPEPVPPPVTCSFTCPLNIIGQDNGNPPHYETAPYDPDEEVTITLNGQLTSISAGLCCSYTTPIITTTCYTCPINIVGQDNSVPPNYITAPYDPAQQVIVNSNGQIIPISASECCCYTTPAVIPDNGGDSGDNDPPAAAAAGVYTTPYYSYTARGSVYVVWTTVTPGPQGLQLTDSGSSITINFMNGNWILRLWLITALITGIGMLIL